MIRKVWMLKSIARKPVAKTETYLKYGFVIVECEKYLCARCGSVLSAGPNYQPKYCDQCGQKVSFKGIEWKKDRDLRCLPINREGGIYEQIKNRMV